MKKINNISPKSLLVVISGATIASMFSMNSNLVFGSDDVTNLVLGKAGYQVDTDFKITGVKESSLKESIKNKLDIQDVQVVEITKNYEARTSIKIKLGEDKAGKEYIVAYVVGVETKERELKIVEEKIKTGKEGEINFVTDHKSYFILIPYSEENLLKLKQDGSKAITEIGPNLSFSDPNANMTLDGEKINNDQNYYIDGNGIEYKLNHEYKTATLIGIENVENIPEELTIGTIDVNGEKYSVELINGQFIEWNKKCVNLKELTIKGSVRSISSAAFKNCKNLTKLTIEEGVERINSYVFNGCSKIEIVKVPNSLKEIEGDAFDSKVKFELPNNKSWYNKNGEKRFDETTKQIAGNDDRYFLKKENEFITVYNKSEYAKDGIKYVRTSSKTAKVIGYDRRKIKNLKIPEAITILDDDKELILEVTEIDNNSFMGYYDLTTVEIPKSVKVIGRDSFFDCKYLEKVIIESSQVEIRPFAFSNCPNLESFETIGVEEIKILKDAFFNSPKMIFVIEDLGEIKIEGIEEIEEIEVDELINNRNRKSIKFNNGSDNIVNIRSSIKDGLEYIENNIKYKLYKNRIAVIAGVDDRGQLVEDLEIPEVVGNNFSVVEVLAEAFKECYNLKKITIPRTVKKIGKGVFLNCRDLKDVVVFGDIDVINQRTFEQCPELEYISFFGNIKKIEKNAFYFCNKLREVYVAFEDFEGPEKKQDVFWNCNEAKIVCEK